MLPRRHPSDIQDARLIAVLVKYVPPIIARSIVERARREAASGPDVSWTDPNGLLDRISVGVRLFAAPEHQSAILREITDLALDDNEPSLPSNRPLSDDPAPSSSLKPSSNRAAVETARTSDSARAAADSSPRISDSSARISDSQSRLRIDDAASTRRDPALSPPPASGGPISGGPISGGPLSGSDRATPASFGAAPPTPASPTLPGGSPSRRDTDIMGVFQSPRRTPADSPPPSRGVFPATPRASSASSPRIPAARPTTPSPGAPPTPLPPASPLPAIIPPPPSSRRTPTPVAGIPRLSPTSLDRVESREITITLTSEHDIPRARQVAREICEALGTRALTQQRLVTIVSELGRNMVLYAGGGKITLRPPASSTRRVVVLAVDQGPGIANLSDIMAGRYKSRSGLGLGIVGTKRLADSFHIETGRNGTAISVEVIV